MTRKQHYDRVIWREGMLITPQHLQQQELYAAQNLHERLAASTPLSWGVQAIEFDAGALKSGRLELTKFEGVMPDGLDLRGGLEVPSRTIGDHFPATAKQLEVSLGIPALREGVANFHEPDSEWRGRFLMVTKSTGDLSMSKNVRNLDFGAPAPVLLFGEEKDEDHVKLKIAEIVRDEDGSFTLSDTYIPPVLHIGASPVLMAGLREIMSLSVVKQRALNAGRRQRDAATIEFAAADVTRYLLLNAINMGLPLVKHYSEEPRSSPLSTYLMMLEYAGALTSFTGEIDPASFPRFAFLDMRSCYLPMFEHIKTMLGAAVKDMSIKIPLEAREDGMWIGRLSEQRMVDCKDWVLAVESDSPEQQVANKLPHLSKMSSWKQISAIVKSATPGVPLQPTHRPPTEVAIKPGQVYFMIKKDDRYWRDVLAERTIAIYVPPPFDPKRAKLSLMGIPRTEG
ncbi:type VI secretion system baseplate subunit TssK [Pseudenhygromyxa sp. WMMC2535]|uniref:type VI secretion system baseplate subunit TssK n=1 Tax=Pseudenhygromyxa sp. WMMC2535 TaxID=2712867 RepID=UPI0015562EDD|nr:type VI secretion system baseplate subunit TssK [Pseudenhygromyxa sp. WMMC2535]NVB36780.1 type VI secretion system baseplate subunit TssK [Pseudenhygromyxa sp. WMMC2535]